MSIPETINFDKEGKPVRHGVFGRLFISIVVILVGFLGYGIGKLDSVGEREGVKIMYDPSVIPSLSASATTTSKQVPSATTGTGVYASSKGTKYYYPNCKSTISPTNKINFASAAMAEKAGYTLAANCKAP